ncbi:MAG: hypothetical protein P8X90_01840 [Desulfobacterales bacterium]
MHLKKGYWIALVAVIMVAAFSGLAIAKSFEFVVTWSAGGGSVTMARFIVNSIKDKQPDRRFVCRGQQTGRQWADRRSLCAE